MGKVKFVVKDTILTQGQEIEKHKKKMLLE